ncbi:MAG: homoserine dehydrogenase [Armatimonadota bacterium]|nr:homoserine dehydrogenase [Armatimonadota bacterium]
MGIVPGVAMPRACGVGMIGLGTVGGAVAGLLLRHGEEIARRAGGSLVLRRVAVAHPGRPRAVALPDGVLVGDARAVIGDPGVDVVVEVMGGLEPARTYVTEALAAGKSVVTANKVLMAARGEELLAAAAAAGTDLFFEASVGGGIPVVKAIVESLAGNEIREIVGILNGTTNYILTRMARDGMGFGEALVAAQRQGFAESDPTDDIDGHDAAAKLAILATVAFGARVVDEDVYREGISRITARDIAYARELGYAVKLLAVARQSDGGIEARVHPALLPTDHPLAAVNEEFNAIMIEGDPVGPVVLEGRGAGGGPTASAVVGDIVDAARNRWRGACGRLAWGGAVRRPVLEIEEIVVPYCAFLEVADRPGVFARVAAAFGDEAVSIASIVQKSRGETADVVLLTHEAREAAMQRVLRRLRALDVVAAIHAVLRIAG